MTKNREISRFYIKSHLQLTMKISCSALLNSDSKLKNMYFFNIVSTWYRNFRSFLVLFKQSFLKFSHSDSLDSLKKNNILVLYSVYLSRLIVTTLVFEGKKLKTPIQIAGKQFSQNQPKIEKIIMKIVTFPRIYCNFQPGSGIFSGNYTLKNSMSRSAQLESTSGGGGGFTHQKHLLQ